MRYRRPAAVVACLAAVAALAVSGASMVTSAAPARAHHAVAHRPSPAFLKQARTALVHYLKTHRPNVMLAHPGGQAHNASSTDSFNWAGYADTSATTGEFTKVSGSWTTPSVTCNAEDQLTSDWVGIDGDTSSTVEQDGTIGWCFEGSPLYFTWYEMYPAGTIEVGTSLQPGDKIAASVTRSGTSYTLKVTDSTNPTSSFTQHATCAATTCLDLSAEWIAERPAFQIGIAPLAKYSKWTLSKGDETAGGTAGTIGSYTADSSPVQLTMIDATQSYNLSTTSALTGGNKFSTTWLNSY